MNERLQTLYKEVILQYSKAPFHFEEKMDCDHLVKANNPVCGDSYKFYINSDPQQFKDVYFHGFGCAISKASSAVLVKLINNQDWETAYARCSAFLEYLDNPISGGGKAIDPDFEAFSAVHEFPSRMDCATLGWRAVQKFLVTLRAAESRDQL